MPNKQEKTRDSKGKWLKGSCPNPKGRPKGISITEMVRTKLKDKPEGMDKATYGDMVVQSILKKALKDNDVKMLRTIWAYMDGMPKQHHDVVVEDISDLSEDQKKRLSKRWNG